MSYNILTHRQWCARYFNMFKDHLQYSHLLVYKQDFIIAKTFLQNKWSYWSNKAINWRISYPCFCSNSMNPYIHLFRAALMYDILWPVSRCSVGSAIWNVHIKPSKYNIKIIQLSHHIWTFAKYTPVTKVYILSPGLLSREHMIYDGASSKTEPYNSQQLHK